MRTLYSMLISMSTTVCRSVKPNIPLKLWYEILLRNSPKALILKDSNNNNSTRSLETNHRMNTPKQTIPD